MSLSQCALHSFVWSVNDWYSRQEDLMLMPQRSAVALSPHCLQTPWCLMINCEGVRNRRSPYNSFGIGYVIFHLVDGSRLHLFRDLHFMMLRFFNTGVEISILLKRFHQALFGSVCNTAIFTTNSASGQLPDAWSNSTSCWTRYQKGFVVIAKVRDQPSRYHTKHVFPIHFQTARISTTRIATRIRWRF